MAQKVRYKLRPEFKNGVKNVIICIFLVGICIFCAVGTFKKVNSLFSLVTEVNEAKAQLAAVQAENEYLINQKEKLTDEDYVSSWARGKYNLTKKGEDVFQLPSSNDED